MNSIINNSGSSGISGESTKGTILLIEDNVFVRMSLRLALELEGHDVLEASNGKVGLDILKNDRSPTPFLILLDLMMPEMDGWEFMDFFQNDPHLKPIPIVIISAYKVSHEDLMAKEFLKKPINHDELFEIVRKYQQQGRDEWPGEHERHEKQ